MSNEQEQPWLQQEGEDTMWYSRFLVYLRMGPSRSFLGSVNEALKQEKKSEIKSSIPGAWWETIKKWNWKARADAYDEHRRKHVFTQGNAYDLHRIERLDKLATMLEERVTRMIDQLPKSPKKKWFNNYMYQAYLDTQDAIAQETGGRIKKQETTLNLPPNIYVGFNPDEDGSEP